MDPTCFENAIGNVHWDDAMNKEMAALESMIHGSWCHCQMARKLLAVNGLQSQA